MANDHEFSDTILVLGGTGKTGRRVAERLARTGHWFRIGSRSAEPFFDWEKPASWAPVLAGVSAVYVAYQPDLAVPGAVETVDAFFRKALAAGVSKIVLLSGRGEIEAQEAEQALQKLDVDWTILRCSWFFQNFSENFLADDIRAGQVALPANLAAEPFVDAEDIADIAVAAFTDPRHTSRLYEITGSAALTFADVVSAIAKATGRRIDFTTVSPADYRAELERQQVPADYIWLITYLFGTVLDGRNISLGDGVQRALGREPGSLADYVRRTAATGIWGGDHA